MSVYDIIKDGVKVARSAGNIELSLELAKVADELLTKQKKIEDLEEENKSLKDKLKNKGNVTFSDGVYWLIIDSEKNRPFCPRCFEKNQELITLNMGFAPPFCPECKNNYDV
jgi:hypothetical protein